MSAPLSPDVARLLEGKTTVAAKIRALAAAGYARAEIARMLGKRYQHVRNVLEEPKAARASLAATPSGFAEADAPPFLRENVGTYRLEVAPDGSTRLPSEVLAALGAPSGGVIIAELIGDRFTLISTMEAIRQLQEWARPYLRPGVSGVDALLAERRREVEMEERESLEHEVWARRDD